MKILYVAPGTPVPGTHGGSIHAAELCRALSRRGHAVHLAAMPADDDPDRPEPSTGEGADGERKRELDGVRLHPLRRRLPRRLLEWTAAPGVLDLARRLEPDVIVERFYTFGGAGLWVARRLGIPGVLEINSPARPYPGSWRDRLDALTLVRPVARWRRRLLEWADGYYATSERLLPPELRSRALVIVNGVDVETFRPGTGTGDDGPLRCAFVSSFRSWHGAEDLVEAVSAAVAAGADLEVECIGDGPRRPAAERAVRDAGLEGRIRFPGSLPHARVAGRLGDAAVGLAPFRPAAHSALELGWFWSPIKLFEYMASGLAVVTADIPDLRDLLPEGVARFYPPGDPGHLGEVLVELDADRDAVRGMGERARRAAVERFTWDRQAARVEALLADVVEGLGVPAP